MWRNGFVCAVIYLSLVGCGGCNTRWQPFGNNDHPQSLENNNSESIASSSQTAKLPKDGFSTKKRNEKSVERLSKREFDTELTREKRGGNSSSTFLALQEMKKYCDNPQLLKDIVKEQVHKLDKKARKLLKGENDEDRMQKLIARCFLNTLIEIKTRDVDEYSNNIKPVENNVLGRKKKKKEGKSMRHGNIGDIDRKEIKKRRRAEREARKAEKRRRRKIRKESKSLDEGNGVEKREIGPSTYNKKWKSTQVNWRRNDIDIDDLLRGQKKKKKGSGFKEFRLRIKKLIKNLMAKDNKRRK